MTLLEIPLYFYSSFIAFLISFFLFFFILKKNPRSQLNQIWALFLVMTMFITLGEGILKIIGDDKEGAIFWFKLLIMPGGGFIAPLFLHFTLIFTKQTKIVKNKILLTIIYLPIVIFYVRGLFVEVPLNELEISGLGFYTTKILVTQVAGPIGFPINMGFIGGFILIGIILLILGYKKTKREIEKIQINYFLVGSYIFLAFNFIVYVLLPHDISQIFSEATSITVVLMAGIITYAMIKYKLMAEVRLVTEDIPSKPIDYELEPGYTYIIPESKPKIGFQLFAKSLSGGAHGICITMENPKIIRKKYGLKKTPIIWITNKETKELSVKPENIEEINEILRPFLRKSADSIIWLIDNRTITQGISLKNHERILEMSRNFFSTVVRSSSRFIISVSPKSINSGKSVPIIKTKTPLLEFNRLAGLVFEKICNEILRFLIRNGYLDPKNIRNHLTNLKRNDPFFKNISYHESIDPTSTTNNKLKITNLIEVKELSKQVMIDKIKIFMSEFEQTQTAINLDSIAFKSVSEYGLSKNEFQLHLGDTYIIPHGDTRRSFEIFSEFVTKSFHGLCISKQNPDKLKRRYPVYRNGVQIYWLTDISEERNDILPLKLEHILSAIEDFLVENPNKKIILLDGIEYLIFYSGDIFDTVLGFLRQLTDRISETNAIILIPLDPKTLSEQRMSLLSRSGIEFYRLN